MTGFGRSLVRLLFFGVITVIAGAVAVGAIYQYLENRRDLRAHAAPGRMLDVGGHRLHLWCEGSGSPVVVLEAGGGGSSLQWSRVQPNVAGTTRVCSYDRAGLGWSELGPNPRSASQIADELHMLLEVAQVPAPYVVVGHSIGGLYVRLYTSSHPGQVVGMVLVDATHEDTQQRMPAEAAVPARSSFGQRFALDLHSFLTIVGYARLAGIRFEGGSWLSPEARRLSEGIKVRTTFPLADGAETLAMEDSASEVRLTRRTLDIPLTVITRGLFRGIRKMPLDQQERIKHAWQDLQADQVRLSSQGIQVVATNADHYVHLEQPEVVSDAIIGVVEKARRRLATTP